MSSFADMAAKIAAMDLPEVTKELMIAEGDEAPPESLWWLRLLSQRTAQIAYEMSVDVYTDANEKVVAACARSFWSTAHVVHVRGDDEGAEFTPRLRAYRVTDSDGNTIVDEEEPTEEWDEFYELSMEYLDWIIEINGDGWYGEQEIEIRP